MEAPIVRNFLNNKRKRSQYSTVPPSSSPDSLLYTPPSITKILELPSPKRRRSIGVSFSPPTPTAPKEVPQQPREEEAKTHASQLFQLGSKSVGEEDTKGRGFALRKALSFSQKMEALSQISALGETKTKKATKERFSDLVYLILRKRLASEFLDEFSPKTDVTDLLDYFKLVSVKSKSERLGTLKIKAKEILSAKPNYSLRQAFLFFVDTKKIVASRLKDLYVKLVDSAKLAEAHVVLWEMITGDRDVDAMRCNSVTSILQASGIGTYDPNYAETRAEVSKFFKLLADLKVDQNKALDDFWASERKLKLAVNLELGIDLEGKEQLETIEAISDLSAQLQESLSSDYSRWALQRKPKENPLKEYGNLSNLYEPKLEKQALFADSRIGLSFYERWSKEDPTALLRAPAQNPTRKYHLLESECASWVDGIFDDPLGKSRNNQDPKKSLWSAEQQTYIPGANNKTLEKHLMCLELEEELFKINAGIYKHQIVDSLENAGISIKVIYERHLSENEEEGDGLNFIKCYGYIISDDLEDRRRRDRTTREQENVGPKNRPRGGLEGKSKRLHPKSKTLKKSPRRGSPRKKQPKERNVVESPPTPASYSKYNIFGLNSLSFEMDKMAAMGSSLYKSITSVFSTPQPAKGEEEPLERLHRPTKDYTGFDIMSAVSELNIELNHPEVNRKDLLNRLNSAFFREQNRFMKYSMPEFDPEEVEYTTTEGNLLSLMPLEGPTGTQFRFKGTELDFDLERLKCDESISEYFESMRANIQAKVYGEKRAYAFQQYIFGKDLPTKYTDFRNTTKIPPPTNPNPTINPFSGFKATDEQVNAILAQDVTGSIENEEKRMEGLCKGMVDLFFGKAITIQKELYRRVESMRSDMLEMLETLGDECEYSDDYRLGELNLAMLRKQYSLCYCICLAYARYYSDPETPKYLAHNQLHSTAYDAFVEEDLQWSLQTVIGGVMSEKNYETVNGKQSTKGKQSRDNLIGAGEGTGKKGKESTSYYEACKRWYKRNQNVINTQVKVEVVLALIGFSVDLAGAYVNNSKEQLNEEVVILTTELNNLTNKEVDQVIANGSEFYGRENMTGTANATEWKERVQNVQKEGTGLNEMGKAYSENQSTRFLIQQAPGANLNCSEWSAGMSERKATPEEVRTFLPLKFLLQIESEFIEARDRAMRKLSSLSRTQYKPPDDENLLRNVPKKEDGSLDSSIEAISNWAISSRKWMSESISTISKKSEEIKGGSGAMMSNLAALDIIHQKAGLVVTSTQLNQTVYGVTNYCKLLSGGGPEPSKFAVNPKPFKDRVEKEEADFTSKRGSVEDQVRSLYEMELGRQRQLISDLLDLTRKNLVELNDKYAPAVSTVQKTCHDSGRIMQVSQSAELFLQNQGTWARFREIGREAAKIGKKMTYLQIVNSVKEGTTSVSMVKVLAATLGYLTRWGLGFTSGAMMSFGLAKFAVDAFWSNIVESAAEYYWSPSMIRHKGDLTPEEVKELEDTYLADSAFNDTKLLDYLLFRSKGEASEFVRVWVLKKRRASTIKSANTIKSNLDIAYTVGHIIAIIFNARFLCALINLGVYVFGAYVIVSFAKYWGLDIPAWILRIVGWAGGTLGDKGFQVLLYLTGLVGVAVTLYYVGVSITSITSAFSGFGNMLSGALGSTRATFDELWSSLGSNWNMSSGYDWTRSLWVGSTFGGSSYALPSEAPIGTVAQNAFNYTIGIPERIFNSTEYVVFNPLANIPVKFGEQMWKAFGSVVNGTSDITNALGEDLPLFGVGGRTWDQIWIPFFGLLGSWFTCYKATRGLKNARDKDFEALYPKDFKVLKDTAEKMATSGPNEDISTNEARFPADPLICSEPEDGGVLRALNTYWESRSVNTGLTVVCAAAVSFMSTYWPLAARNFQNHLGDAIYFQVVEGSDYWRGAIGLSAIVSAFVMINRKIAGEKWTLEAEELDFNSQTLFSSVVAETRKEYILKLQRETKHRGLVGEAEMDEWKKNKRMLAGLKVNSEKEYQIQRLAKLNEDIKVVKQRLETEKHKLKEKDILLEAKLSKESREAASKAQKESQEAAYKAQKESREAASKALEDSRKTASHELALIAAEANMRFRVIDSLLKMKPLVAIATGGQENVDMVLETTMSQLGIAMSKLDEIGGLNQAISSFRSPGQSASSSSQSRSNNSIVNNSNSVSTNVNPVIPPTTTTTTSPSSRGTVDDMVGPIDVNEGLRELDLINQDISRMISEMLGEGAMENFVNEYENLIDAIPFNESPAIIALDTVNTELVEPASTTDLTTSVEPAAPTESPEPLVHIPNAPNLNDPGSDYLLESVLSPVIPSSLVIAVSGRLKETGVRLGNGIQKLKTGKDGNLPVDFSRFVTYTANKDKSGTKVVPDRITKVVGKANSKVFPLRLRLSESSSSSSSNEEPSKVEIKQEEEEVSETKEERKEREKREFRKLTKREQEELVKKRLEEQKARNQGKK